MKKLSRSTQLPFILLILLSFIYLSGCSREPSDVSLNIKGTIVDAEDLSPIPDAIVSFRKMNWSTDDVLKKIKTDVSGEYHFEYYYEGFCPAPLLKVRAEKEGYFLAQTSMSYFDCVEEIQICDLQLKKLPPK
ncbi:MAG: hypothetical protein HKN68_10170 [Saprospiraceae bacterium]|nr:hypothetical protein [Saprospiraceae bacterium]